eukprot:CAMPEP_0171318542 /NCGR_PEP_ID=MMETSP0816-20121228/89288_1 /TAXON_ID=420281 /ORGANISM="Proboscia inermis, Strain CCAP1064/1" /LENGTH=42 /DNA_ID= /DNA_START= /DNA_END= /DNA_ORIENTATION=
MAAEQSRNKVSRCDKGVCGTESSSASRCMSKSSSWSIIPKSS